MTIVFINTGTSVDLRQFANLQVIILTMIIFVGIAARGVGVFISLYPKTYTNKERLFASAAFLPKGTATAGAIVYIQIMIKTLAPGDPVIDIVTQLVFPTIIMTATMAILITIPLSIPVINKLGPILLVPPEGGVPKGNLKTSSDPSKDGKKVVAKKTSTKAKKVVAKKPIARK
jgi:NhaP-type Na+/H+ and K+/H+ antiporter